LITLLVVLLSFGMVVVAFPQGASALLVVLIPSLIALGIFRHYTEEKDFITKIFLSALLVRLVFGIFVHVFDLREFFGGDAGLYDSNGALLMEQWIGQTSYLDPVAEAFFRVPGWGMFYVVGAIYTAVGRNILAAQSFCGVVGAATAPMIYFCAEKVYHNQRVAKMAAIFVAFFPAFIIWSGQLLKDGLIVFLLVLAMTMVLQLQERFNYGAVVALILSLAAILPLRFYVFYMVAIAVTGSFVVGFSKSVKGLVRSTVVLVMLGLALTYLGVTRNASTDLETYGDLQMVQRSREDLANSASSGFASDIDVSTTQGAISAVPVGLAYLMLAPFPWEAASLRQSITLPEVLVWWGLIPFLIAGVWWTLRNRLRPAIPILIFTLMLTLAYSIFQGNVGTAYRQRTQIQVFLFIFIAVGIQLFRERREDREIRNQERRAKGGRIRLELP
jgi:4-amino-4-deoxy-L-arabinose transferase-like glycosyltransferase